MNITKYTTVLLALLFISLTACYKDNPYWLDENIKKGGTYYPVIQEFYATPVQDSSFVEGGTAELSLLFWSRDEVKQLEFYKVEDSTEILLKKAPYNPTFDHDSEAWLQSIEYKIPAGTSGTVLNFRAVVRTVNDLTKDATTSIAVE